MEQLDDSVEPGSLLTAVRFILWRLCVITSSLSLFREKCEFFFKNKIFIVDSRKLEGIQSEFKFYLYILGS